MHDFPKEYEFSNLQIIKNHKLTQLAKPNTFPFTRLTFFPLAPNRQRKQRTLEG